MKKLKYTKNVGHKLLSLQNDSSSIAELQAWKWGTIKGKMNFIMHNFTATKEEAKQVVEKWLKNLE